MFLLPCPISLMIKRQTAAAWNGRLRGRRDSAVRTLVAETLVLAKTHGYVEKIENELEEELQRDTSEPPSETVARWRRRGDKLFKSKYMLLAVVIVCITDCALVLGEIILDLHKVKLTLEDTNRLSASTMTFLEELEDKYGHLREKAPAVVFRLILASSINWTAESNSTVLGKQAFAQDITSPSDRHNHTSRDIHLADEVIDDAKEEIDIHTDIAHAFHYCSITLLGILVIETMLKAMCAGLPFFHRKLELFDAFIVIVSFLVDFSFLVFLPEIDTADFVFILAILLPWRVIRVVDSLVVAVKDHEHFRLKLVYGRKKKIQNNLRDTESIMHKYRLQCTTLQRLCLMEGIEEWKLDQVLREDDSVTPTPSKKKFKFKWDEAFLHGERPRRESRSSLPSLDLQGAKFLNGSATKPRSSLPSIAFNTLKQHFTKSGGSGVGGVPSRRASLATVEMLNTKAFTCDLKRKKVASDDLSTMQEDNKLMKPKGDSQSSVASSDSSDKDVQRCLSLAEDPSLPRRSSLTTSERGLSNILRDSPPHQPLLYGDLDLYNQSLGVKNKDANKVWRAPFIGNKKSIRKDKCLTRNSSIASESDKETSQRGSTSSDTFSGKTPLIACSDRRKESLVGEDDVFQTPGSTLSTQRPSVFVDPQEEIPSGQVEQRPEFTCNVIDV